MLCGIWVLLFSTSVSKVPHHRNTFHLSMGFSKQSAHVGEVLYGKYG